MQAEGILSWSGQDQLLVRKGSKDRAIAAELGWDHHDGGKGGGEDQRVLDHSDQRRRAQAAGIGEGCEHDEGDDQWYVPSESAGWKTEAADHDLHADELKGDVRHGGDDPG